MDNTSTEEAIKTAREAALANKYVPSPHQPTFLSILKRIKDGQYEDASDIAMYVNQT